MYKSYQRLLINQQRFVAVLDQKLDMILQENKELKVIVDESQRKYEKAVREMQFFKKKYDQWQDWDRSTGSVFSTGTHQTGSTNVSSMICGSYQLPHSPKSVITPPVRSNITQKTDSLSFGGSDALWDTIAKAKGADVTVEKIISNFLRRGGSPNTAKQSPTFNNVKYGYGMIHALVVTKSPTSLDLLLQQGADPNVLTLTKDDPVSPCYLASSVGWTQGLQKLVAAGGDLILTRGNGKKTVLHAATENAHLTAVQYILQVTQGLLYNETDINGANTLHFACASGHTELVSLIIQTCQIPINSPDNRGETPFYWAVRRNNTEIACMLIEKYGATINVYIHKKLPTPYDIAKSLGHKKLAELLKSKGGLSSKKMDKKRDEELSSQIPKHLENVLAKNGFFMD